jgi:sugar lactone lactonase YvrE
VADAAAGAAAGSSGVVSGWTARPGERYRLGEGSRLVDGRLVMVDIPTGRLLDAETGAVLVELDEPLGAVAPRAGGGWLAAAGPGFAVIGADGGVEWLARPEERNRLAMRMNDAVADPAGRFWGGSMALDQSADGARGAGSLFRVDPDGSVRAVLDGLTIPNGPAFSADGATMYLAESTEGVIRRAAVDAAGDVGPLEVFARVEGGVPDGMAVDADGNLWSAVHGGARLDRYRPDGTLIERIALPARQPTSVCLTDTGPFRVLVTSAAEGLSDAGPDDGAVLTATAAVGGYPARVARLDR